MSIVFINVKTNEKVYIDADDFEGFCKYMSDKDWAITFEGAA